jgi:hypothetical protein
MHVLFEASGRRKGWAKESPPRSNECECSPTPITDANVAAAATAWVTNPVTATATYGPIAEWNTAAVTSMASLFYPTVAPSTSGTARPTFNGDISKWNVARVANMHEVCALWVFVCVCVRACVRGGA